MKKTASPSGVLQIFSWLSRYSSSARRFLIIRNEHEVETPIRPPRGQQEQRGPTDCWIMHNDQNVSVSREFIQHRGEL